MANPRLTMVADTRVREALLDLPDQTLGDWRAAIGDPVHLADVQLGEAVPVVLGYSVELLRAGVAWEILLMGEELLVADAIGRYVVRLRIPRLPLAPGRYYLNLFLKTRPRERAHERSVVCDVRSWTHGNALALTVEGSVCPSVTSVPLSWIREGALP